MDNKSAFDGSGLVRSLRPAWSKVPAPISLGSFAADLIEPLIASAKKKGPACCCPGDAGTDRVPGSRLVSGPEQTRSNYRELDQLAK